MSLDEKQTYTESGLPSTHPSSGLGGEAGPSDSFQMGSWYLKRLTLGPSRAGLQAVSLALNPSTPLALVNT